MSLPVIQPQPALRTSRMTRRRATVLLLVHLVIAAHIAHWLLAGRTVTPVEPSEAAALARDGVVNVGLIFFAATILLTMVFGRFFCGWGCHVLALQDLCAHLLKKLGRRPKALRSRLLRWVPAAVAIYVFVWPMLYRLWHDRGLPPLHLELTTSEFWSTFPGWTIGILTLLVCGFAVVYFLGAKGFCTFACPYGAFFATADRLSPMRIRVTDACEGCGHCTATCTSNVRVHEEVRDFGMVVDDGCMKCMDCVSVCPNDALYYGAGPLPGKAAGRAGRWRRPDLSWSEEAVLAVAFLAGFLVVRGLYGLVPLLMALGCAGIIAYLALLGFQLLFRPHVKLKGLRLKRRGALLPAGRAVLALLVLLAALLAHSGLVRYHAFQGARAFRAITAYRGVAVDPASPAPEIDGALRRRLVRGAEHLARADRIGLIPTAGAAAQQAYFHALLGESGALAEAGAEAIARGELAADMHLLLAKNAEARGDRNEAADRYRAAESLAPRRAEPYLGLGRLLAERGDPEAASAVLERGLESLPRSSGMAYNAGVARAMVGDTAGAVARFERALALDPRHREARENLAGTLAHLGRYAESAAQLEVALAQRPDDADTWSLYARVLERLDRSADAARAAAEARRLGGDDAMR